VGQRRWRGRDHRISKYAEQSLGDIVYVDVPKVGASVEAGKTLGSVESVKAVSDIYSPVTGEVTEVNTELATAPEKINEDPYEKAGWPGSSCRRPMN